MPSQADSVKDILDLLRSEYRAAKADSDPDRMLVFSNMGQVCQAVLEFVEEAEDRLRPLPQDLGDISDLPEELINELQGAKVDDLEQQVVDVIRAIGEPANLDAILMGLFRKFEVSQKRRYLMNRLYKMAQRKLILAVPKKKAVYTLPEFGDLDKDGLIVDITTEEEDDFPF